MKAVFYLLLMAAIGLGVYRFRDQIAEFVESKSNQNVAAEDAPPGTIRVLPAPAEPSGDPGAEAGGGAPGGAGAGPDPAPGEGMAAAGPGDVEEPPAEPEPELDPRIAEIIDRHPLPEFQPLEEIVGNWKDIPASAFPREVTLNTQVKMVLAGGVGESVVPPGTRVTAMSIGAGDILTIRPNRTSKVEGKVPLGGTDLKEVLTAVYENFKKRKTNVVLAQRAREIREVRRAEMAAKAADAAAAALLGPQPDAAPNGVVPVAAASITAKDVTEFDLGSIKAWGPVLYDEIEGEPFWTVSVSYDASTIFGTFPAEAVALIRKSKVERWVYAGSGEPVP